MSEKEDNQWSRVEEPVTTPGGPHDDSVTTHPAFGMISGSRCSGETYLAGSDFSHQHFICITIKGAQLHRGLSRDWWFGRKENVEVWLSEAQWATFVSSLNAGDGIPCTLRHLGDGKPLPLLPPPKARLAQFKAEANEDVREAFAHMDKLQEEINSLGMSNKRTKGLMESVEFIRKKLTDALPFVGKQFGEHMEKTVERAKVEVNAYVQAMVQRSGLAALGGDAAKPPVALEEKPEEEVR